jgi:hypothetical protein
MSYPVVLARASRGEPLTRIAVGSGKKLIYLVNPTRLDALEAGNTSPVGFPREDVFQFDEDLARRLGDQWKRKGRTTDLLWQEALLLRFNS